MSPAVKANVSAATLFSQAGPVTAPVPDPRPVERPAYVVTEGIAGTWFYHWSLPDRTERSLCGSSTMRTHVPAHAWGKVSHIRERWCRPCAAIVNNLCKLGTPDAS